MKFILFCALKLIWAGKG